MMHANLMILIFLIKYIACKREFHTTTGKTINNKNSKIESQILTENYDMLAPYLADMVENIKNPFDLDPLPKKDKITNKQTKIRDFEIEQRSFFPGHASDYETDERWLENQSGARHTDNLSHLKSNPYSDDISSANESPWQAEGGQTNDIDNRKNRNHPTVKSERNPENEINGHYHHHYHHFDAPWRNDPWKNEATVMMNSLISAMIKNGMIPNSNKKGFSILDRLANIDSKALLVAGIIPMGLLLAAVLPSLMHMMMNGNGLPTFITTAYGGNMNNADNTDDGENDDIRSLDTTSEMLLKLIGIKSLDQHLCISHIICQIAKETILKTHRTATLLDPQWLNSLGLNKFFGFLQENDCEKIHCSTENGNQQVHPHKVEEGS